MNYKVFATNKLYHRKLTATDLVYCFPLLLLLLFWITRPFPKMISSNTVHVGSLSSEQKINIALALKKIDSVIVKSGETFSFNSVVGPRKIEYGFLEAPTYLNGKTILTEGGGICLVSSLLYRSALESNLSITARHAHSRPIRSVPPGLDATVIYGKFDLAFQNKSKTPIIIRTNFDRQNASIEIWGNNAVAPNQVITNKESSSTSGIKTSVFKQKNGKLIEVSRDQYKLN